MIDTLQSLENAALTYGMLPFFRNTVKGFSVEEMAAPGMLFSDDADSGGCWQWKGPVIQRGNTAYGKFFRRKAGFVSLELLPDFINYRRATYPLKAESLEEGLYSIIASLDRTTSAELRRYVFGNSGRRRAGDLVDMEEPVKVKRQSLEPTLQKLQMAGRVCIADFVYKTSSRGERYGWGEALYTTPEILYGKNAEPADRSPQESFERLVDCVARHFPHTDRNIIAGLLK